ncbi:MAG TPA: hypothetical protein VFY87_22325, partial [Geminicoccaceae bacterium]|nr:hypothetical protein [Geminicoccaceae bacterium]
GQAGRGRAAPASPGKAPRDRPPAALADPPPTAPNPLYALSARNLVANGTIVLRSLGQEIPLDEIYA